MIRKLNEGYSVGDKVTFDANARGVHPKITTGTIVFKGRTVAMHGFPAEDMYTVKLDNGNTVTIGNFEIEAAGGNPVTEKTRTNHKKNYKEANAYNLDDAESRRKEIADRFGRTFTPDDHILVCKDGKKLNIQVGKKYKCTACNGQRVEIVSIDELFPEDNGDSALITAYYRGNMIAIGSNQLYESVNKKKLTKEDYDSDGFAVTGYIYPNRRGAYADRYFGPNDWSEVESYAYDLLMRGLFVNIIYFKTGDTVDIDPNTEFDGDFDATPEIVEFKRKVLYGESVCKKRLTKEGYGENEEIANLLFDIETTGDSRIINKAYNFIDKYCDNPDEIYTGEYYAFRNASWGISESKIIEYLEDLLGYYNESLSENITGKCLNEEDVEYTDGEITVPVVNLFKYDNHEINKLYTYCDTYLVKNHLDAHVEHVEANADTKEVSLIYDIDNTTTTSHNQVEDAIRTAVEKYFSTKSTDFSDGVVNYSVPYHVANLDEYDREQFNSLTDWCNDYLSEYGLDAHITAIRHYRNELSVFYNIENLETTAHTDVMYAISCAADEFFTSED